MTVLVFLKRNNNILKLFIGFTLIISIISCHNKYDKKYGYIVFTESESFQFVPVKNRLNTSTSISSFMSENLDEGFQFGSTFDFAFYNSVFLHVDTFMLENLDTNFPKKIRTLKIVPVYIEYEKKRDRNFPFDIIKYQIKGRVITCKWNFDIYKLHRVTFIPYENRNLKGNYIEAVTMCPPTDKEHDKMLKSLKNLERNDWYFE